MTGIFVAAFFSLLCSIAVLLRSDNSYAVAMAVSIVLALVVIPSSVAGDFSTSLISALVSASSAGVHQDSRRTLEALSSLVKVRVS